MNLSCQQADALVSLLSNEELGHLLTHIQIVLEDRGQRGANNELQVKLFSSDNLNGLRQWLKDKEAGSDDQS